MLNLIIDYILFDAYPLDKLLWNRKLSFRYISLK
jgi:hypothetical protein